jgi:3'-phosphoadenosine 5'-phosphosulfate sulfotransferase (PAPS reductase)/FAD synthetase
VSAALFDISEAFDGDPIRPDMETPTPAEMVARLTRPDREKRVLHLIDQAHDIYDEGIAAWQDDREIVARCILFSGGNDSTTLAHLFRPKATHAIHANTTIGIEQTRQYVRDTCAAWELPLIEERPDDSFADLVLGKVNGWPGGFPGPGAHGTIYQRIKERALDKARHTLGIANSRSKCALFIGGRRREESERRSDVPLHEPDGTVIWISPIALWTKLDLNTYRLMHGDVPHNPVTANIHMSGECLCGAFAKPGELEMIRYFYPDVAAEIDALADQARSTGLVAEKFCTWGHGLRGKAKVEPTAGRLCQSCKPPAETPLFGGAA